MAGRHLASKTGPTRTSTSVDRSASQTEPQLAMPFIGTHRAVVAVAAAAPTMPPNATNMNQPKAIINKMSKIMANSNEMSSAITNQQFNTVSATENQMTNTVTSSPSITENVTEN
jgi:hypothetical protein